MIPYSEPKLSDLYTYPRVSCLKTIPFIRANTYIAHIMQFPPQNDVSFTCLKHGHASRDQIRTYNAFFNSVRQVIKGPVTNYAYIEGGRGGGEGKICWKDHISSYMLYKGIIKMHVTY